MRSVVLQMVFNTEMGGRWTLNIANPSEVADDDTVKLCGQEIVAANVFDTTTGDLVSLRSAAIITTSRQELDVA